jgi:hypothetical protein
MLTKSEFFEALGDTIRANKAGLDGWRVNKDRAWEAYRANPAPFHAKTQDNPTGHVGVGVVVNAGPWWEPDLYIMLYTEDTPGLVWITDRKGKMIATLGNIAWDTDAGSPSRTMLAEAGRVAAAAGWLVSGDWDVTTDSYCAPVKREPMTITA